MPIAGQHFLSGATDNPVLRAIRPDREDVVGGLLREG